jgi:multicomponent Na+:H+ antiporter subunit G
MINIFTALITLFGLVAFLGGTAGILRFPDFYTRLHAAGKLDSFGSLLILLALALYNFFPVSWGSLITSAKIALIIGFLFMASPTATHAIVDAGVRAGLTPWAKREGERP